MTDKPLTIGVLETGRAPDEIAQDFDSYPEMIHKWLGSGHIAKTFAVLDMDLPSDPAEADIWVITGSKFGAYEPLPWIKPLEEFIRKARDAGAPMVGICFGHQVMAQALGGKVVKSDKGWGLGIHHHIPESWPTVLGRPPKAVSLAVHHQDQVVELPPDATRIAGTDFCENGAIWYPGFGISFQGHPEYSAEFLAALIGIRRGMVYNDAAAEDGLSTLADPDNRDEMATLVLRAFTGQSGS